MSQKSILCVWLLAVGVVLVPVARATDQPAREGDKRPAVPNETLRRALLDRVAKDQKARMDLLAWMRKTGMRNPEKLKDSDQPRFARLRAIDEENTAWLKQIVNKSGWPCQSDVGTDGAHAAWLLLQHADRDPKFQRKCLDLMSALLPNEVSPTDVAYLTDRVMLKETGKQRFGTQVEFVDGKAKPRPLEDPEHVEQLRKQAGMIPLAEYLKFVEKMYLGPPTPGQGQNQAAKDKAKMRRKEGH